MYTESDYTKKKKQQLDTLESQKPGEYQSQYTQQSKDAMAALTDRKAFSYDVNEDALYQQMKDNYISQGRLAMQDTMGQAAAMTGGYGNSYAQGVGQQAYQGYLQQLNNNIPEYYQQALNAYNAEGDRLREAYDLLSGQESRDYDRYMDSWNRWNSERQQAQSDYESSRDYDRSLYESDRNYDRDVLESDRNYEFNKAESDRNYEFNKSESDRDYEYTTKKNDQQLAQAQVDYLISQGVTPNADLLAAAGYDQQYIDQAVKANTKSSGGYSTAQAQSTTTDESVEMPSFSDVSETARTMAANGEDADAYLAAAQKAGAITPAQRKSLNKTLGL